MHKLSVWHTVRFVDTETPPHTAAVSDLWKVWKNFRGCPVIIGRMFARDNVTLYDADICDCTQFFEVPNWVGWRGGTGVVCRAMLEMD